LTGSKPSDLPVEQPDNFDFISVAAAKALGLQIPGSVLLAPTTFEPCSETE
jgi:hypothetical protein